MPHSTIQIIILGGGCFWCTEATFRMIRGVVSVTPGYAGGITSDPSYYSVCNGTTGHAEVVRIEFDPQVISFRDVLTVFFATHDPTTRNRQGADVGTEYRSIILYTTQEQKEIAKTFIEKLAGEIGKKIVTEIAPLDVFYEAEEEHHRYYEKHPEQAYCQAVIEPKMTKLRKQMVEFLK